MMMVCDRGYIHVLSTQSDFHQVTFQVRRNWTSNIIDFVFIMRVKVLYSLALCKLSTLVARSAVMATGSRSQIVSHMSSCSGTCSSTSKAVKTLISGSESVQLHGKQGVKFLDASWYVGKTR